MKDLKAKARGEKAANPRMKLKWIHQNTSCGNWKTKKEFVFE